ncbi:hypothetical protein BESB_062700 [Besnoitia besnoiti]|uniref:Chromo domain-containing protein n=1 Tax=Besnoitia besnoiti TaxID=94643 RepID=A0A2A9MIC3_BESBE|nr:hypothetical protein BESB_062700 [Besnoitia besnoiti]PFH35383.1 hypothetical protein BESB_062700 [Besnoitia besnoiti]
MGDKANRCALNMEIYGVAEIVAYSCIYSRDMYLARWKHYPNIADFTWEPRGNFRQNLKATLVEQMRETKKKCSVLDPGQHRLKLSSVSSWQTTEDG